MYSITDYGAVSGGASTAAVQKTVDICHANGGGVVYVPYGTYEVASIRLYSNIHFVFEAGAVFLGASDPDEFHPREKLEYPLYQDGSHSYVQRSMFCAEDCENISFSGNGTIDMQSVWENEPVEGEIPWCEKRAVKIFGFKRCRNITIKELSLLRATDVAVYLAGCETVQIHGLTLDVNIDGISPDCCKDVVISDCTIRSGDDSIVLKSSYILNEKRMCENIVISNCIISSRCNAIKLGTESIGGFRNIAISNCLIYNTYLAGVALEITDGGRMDGVAVSNLSMRNTGYPFFIILSDRRRGPRGTRLGSMQNISIDNVVAIGPYEAWLAPQLTALWHGEQITQPEVLTSSITGQPDKKIRNISLSNIRITVSGGGNAEDREIALPEITREYPENNNFGTVFPASGIFFRHVENLSLSNVYVETMEPDMRDTLVFEDVVNLRMENTRSFGQEKQYAPAEGRKLPETGTGTRQRSRLYAGGMHSMVLPDETEI